MVAFEEPNPEMLKNATVYPSLDQGVKNLTLRLLDKIDQNRPEKPPQHLHIVVLKRDRAADAVRSVLIDRFPATEVNVDDKHTTQPDELMLTLGIDDSQKTQKCLRFSAHWNGRNYTPVEACVKDALWAVDLDAYRTEHPNGEWIVGSSFGIQPSGEAALNEARADAANKMLPFVVTKFPQLNQPNQGPWLLSKLESQLRQQKFNTKEFVQEFHLPATGAKVYKAAVLADHSSPQLAVLNKSVIPEFHRRTDAVRHFSLGTMGLGVVICIVYLFLNWATRGYFQMNLRLGAFLVLIAGVLLLLTIS